MEIRQGSRSRNNRIIFITAGVAFLLTILSLLPPVDSRVVKIRVGDSGYQAANLLTQNGIAFRPLVVDGVEGLVVDYSPVSPWERFRHKEEGSYYEIRFKGDRVAEIIRRDSEGRQMASLLDVRVVAGH